MDKFIEYAPLLVIVCTFLLKNKIFITPEQLNKALNDKKNNYREECKELYVTKEDIQIERKKLLEAVASVYLEKAVFEIAQRRIDDKLDNADKRFDKVDDNLQHIIDLLLQKTSD